VMRPCEGRSRKRGTRENRSVAPASATTNPCSLSSPVERSATHALARAASGPQTMRWTGPRDALDGTKIRLPKNAGWGRGKLADDKRDRFLCED
jgi:hypothetical protein